MQEVNLDKKIKLLDSPGVVMDAMQNPVTAVLRNIVRVRVSLYFHVPDTAVLRNVRLRVCVTFIFSLATLLEAFIC
jgi:hypothetical protein